MREEEFRQWLASWVTPNGGALNDSITNFYVNAIIRVERAENINLDEEFQKDGLASISQLYSYSAQDNRDKRTNPTNLEITKPSPYGTLADYKSALNHYRRFCLGEGDAPIQEVPDNNNGAVADTGAGTTFGLEADLQKALRKHITQLEAGLEVIDNELEHRVKSGFIDILAKDSQGRYVIIELYTGIAGNDVVSKILKYMVDIAEAEGQLFEQVRGIIVASDFDEWVRIASQGIPNLDLNSDSYTLDFKKET